MRMALLAVATMYSLASISTPAIAQTAPIATRMAPSLPTTDARIQTVLFNPNQVVALRGHFDFQMTIEFSADERIANVSIGDALAWQVTPNRAATLLFIKPVESARTTNMTVVTDKRRYVFELTARRAPDPHVTGMVYVLRFTYPPEPPAIAVAQAPVVSLPRNTSYTYTGSRAMLPSLVFDDGRFTYFRWPQSVPNPAIFLVATDGSESIVNYGVRDGYVVVEQVAPQFILRNGRDVTTIFNGAWREPTLDPLAPRPHDDRTARAAARSRIQRQ